MPKSKHMTFPQGQAQGASVQPRLPGYIKADGNSFAIDIARLPMPAETYVTNVAWVEREGSSVSIFFGKRDRDNAGRLKTRVEFRFSLEAFLNLWKNSNAFHDGLHVVLAKLFSDTLVQGGDSSDPMRMPAEKEHTFSANIAIATHAGTQAEIDFYDLPATDIFLSQKFNDLRRLEVRALLRVFLPIEVLSVLFDHIKKMAAEIEPFVMKMMHKEQSHES